MYANIISGIRRHQNFLMALLLMTLALLGIRLWPHQLLSQHAPSSIAVYDTNEHLLRLTLTSDDKYRVWVPLSDFNPTLVDAVLLHEDRWFRFHAGVNPFSLARGAFVTYVKGANRQGGSTLTMQLARLMYRLNTRTPYGKLVQIVRAIELELCYSKQRILEAYLNYAPYGRNIEGAGAASLVYFDKPVGALNLPEALTLAVIPQDPTRRSQNDASPGYAPAEVINQKLAQSRNRLYRRWLKIHPADANQAALFQLPLHLRAPEHLPFAAPHFVEQVLFDAKQHNQLAPTIATTLDLGLQQIVESQLKAHIEHQRERGIHNAAAVLIDTRDMGVKALVGSANYLDESIAGQVNGANAKRSPGSTLKPFIYAMGMDQGLLHPLTMLKDVPTSFGPFTPENYDGRFLGPVSATDALIRSRNIPAVGIAAKLTSPSFYQFLKNSGIGRMASEEFYGLALVLGGGEVTLEELARLYAMLANRGELKPLRFRTDEPSGQGVRMLSEEASFMVLDMLRQNPRPDDALTAQPMRLPVRWKTGTSWGFRDAWSAGVFGPYVLIVWIGNFDGSGNPAFIGIEAAAPLFFHIVDALRAHDPNLSEPPRPIPDNVKKVEVCLASGDLPNAWCPQRASTWFIPGKSPIRVSNIHRPVVVDAHSGKPVCPPYDPESTRIQVYEFWPSDMAKVFAQAGMPRRVPPTVDCADAGSSVGDGPHITAPLRGAVYTHRASRSDADRIGFNATADADTRSLYWFVNDAFIGQAHSGETLFWQPLHAGQYTVRAMDDHGRADSRELHVAVVP